MAVLEHAMTMVHAVPVMSLSFHVEIGRAHV